MPSPSAPRRGRPPSVDQDRILTATYELLREKGVARLSTREIAERAGVAEGSIFYRYKDRAGLLIAVYADALRPMAEYERNPPDLNDIRATLANFTELLENYLERALTVLYSAQADTELRAALHEHIRVNDIGPHHGLKIIGGYLADLQAQGHIRPDIDPAAAASLLLDNCHTRVALPRLFGRGRGVVSRDAILDTFLTSMAPTGNN
ncbi:TetR/AcrR family transcriptional regulator [Nocardia sp. NBC_00511]|uniref:TetR/AcrR family transcriptional regulator n=1 Tax=Nocardia sp. NBC_00511 TaxID=2903591 RepID=UPI0030E0E919